MCSHLFILISTLDTKVRLKQKIAQIKQSFNSVYLCKRLHFLSVKNKLSVIYGF